MVLKSVYKSLNYNAFIPIAIQAVKQLDSTISAPPAAPVLISPADGAMVDGRAVTFTWHSVSQGIVIYHAQIAKDNSFSNTVFYDCHFSALVVHNKFFSRD